MIALVLTLMTAAAPQPTSCGAYAYCIAELHHELCEAYGGARPKGLTPQERVIIQLEGRMAAQGCAVPDMPSACPAPPAARAAPPVDCRALRAEAED